MELKKILIITCSLESPNGICAQAIIEEAAARNIQVDCVCSAEYAHNTDIVTYYPVKKRLMDKFFYGTQKFSKWEYWLFLTLSRILSLLMLPCWPFSAPLYYFRLKKKALALAEKNHYDAVIGTYSFYECLLVAKDVKRMHPEVMFVPYFLDCLAGGQGPRYLSRGMLKVLGAKAEAKVLKYADLVVIMDSHKSFYKSLWRGTAWENKVKVLDIPLLNVVSNTKKSSISDFIHIVYTGALQANLKNPKGFLDILAKGSFSDVKVSFIGPSDCNAIIQAMRVNADAEICQMPPVDHRSALKIIQQADVLLNIGSANPRQIPCKIFEYMATGKPIINVCPIRDEPSIKYLDKYPATLTLFEDNEAKMNASELRTFLNKIHDFQIDILKLMEKFYICTPKAFMDILEDEK